MGGSPMGNPQQGNNQPPYQGAGTNIGWGGGPTNLAGQAFTNQVTSAQQQQQTGQPNSAQSGALLGLPALGSGSSNPITAGSTLGGGSPTNMPSNQNSTPFANAIMGILGTNGG